MKKLKGDIITFTEMDNYFIDIYNTINELTNNNIEDLTTGQLVYTDTDAATEYDFYNYCGTQACPICNGTFNDLTYPTTEQNYIRTPFINLNNELETIIDKATGKK